MSKQPSAPPPGDKPTPTAPPPPPAWRHWLWPIALIATVALYILLPGINNTNTVTLTYSKFIATASQHQIKDVTCSSSSNGGNTSASGTLTNGKSYTTVIPGAPSTQLANQLRADGVKSVTASANSPGLGSELLYWLVLLAPLVFVIWLFRRMSRGATGALQGALGVGRSRAKVFDAERPSTKFSDVAGYEGAKQEISEIIDFLRNPGRYQRAGAMAPRGVLMVGPPGTGKTLLARAGAGEASVPFFSVTGSSFVEMFVGVGAARVRDLFSEARKRAPAPLLPGEGEAIAASDFDDARDRILLGRREGSNVLLPEEKHAVAVHEAGHALVAALSEHADPVAKVTILPAGQALGVTQQLPLIERHLYGEDYLRDSLAVRLGGRASELVELGQGSTGAANDLSTATDMATRMVREFGLSDKLGPIGYPQGGSVFLGGGGNGFTSRPFAESTQAAIDAEVARLLREAEQTAVGLIRTHREMLGELVELLLERETVDGAEVYRIAGRPVPEHRPPEEVSIGPRARALTFRSAAEQPAAAGE